MFVKIVSLWSIMVATCFGMIEIKQLESQYLKQVETVMAEVCHEVFELGESAQALEQELEQMGEFKDIRNAQQIYFGNGGTFLLLMDDDKVFGMGGIKRLSDDICELKKMLILKKYREQGYGALLNKKLEAFAQEQGYKKIHLEFWFPEKQSRIIRIVREQGFYEIDPYRESGAKICMEKKLSS